MPNSVPTTCQTSRPFNKIRLINDIVSLIHGLRLVPRDLLDFFDGLHAEHPLNQYTKLTERHDISAFTQARFGHTPYDTLQHFSRAVEEFLEMVVMTIFWLVFLVELAIETFACASRHVVRRRRGWSRIVVAQT